MLMEMGVGDTIGVSSFKACSIDSGVKSTHIRHLSRSIDTGV